MSDAKLIIDILNNMMQFQLCEDLAVVFGEFLSLKIVLGTSLYRILIFQDYLLSYLPEMCEKVNPLIVL